MFSTLRRRKKGWLQIMDVKLIRFFKFNPLFRGSKDRSVLIKLVEVWNLKEIYGHACLPFYFLKKRTLAEKYFRSYACEWMVRKFVKNQF